MRLQLPGKWGGKKRLSGGEKSNATQIQGLQEMYKATAKELEKNWLTGSWSLKGFTIIAYSRVGISVRKKSSLCCISW